VEALTPRILMTSIAVAMLVGTEGIFAGNALDAAYGLQDRDAAFDAQGTDQEGIRGPARQSPTRRCGPASRRKTRSKWSLS
jgi:hypothetical protein